MAQRVTLVALSINATLRNPTFTFSAARRRETPSALCALSILRSVFPMNAFMQEVAGRKGMLPGFVPTAIQPKTGSVPITVLLVDDDDQVRAFCRSLLTDIGFTVLEARNGLEALLTSIQHQVV